MLPQLSECIAFVGPPNLVLRATNALLRYYPTLLRAGLVLQRLVQ
jgi:hypothetical protein